MHRFSVKGHETKKGISILFSPCSVSQEIFEVGDIIPQNKNVNPDFQ